MPDQKVMKLHLAKPDTVSIGDIVQCPCCCEKFVVMPRTIVSVYWDPQTQGPEPEEWEDYDYVSCPVCGRGTGVEYFVAAYAAGVELPTRPKPKEAKPDADAHKRSRKRTTQQRS